MNMKRKRKLLGALYTESQLTCSFMTLLNLVSMLLVCISQIAAVQITRNQGSNQIHTWLKNGKKICTLHWRWLLATHNGKMTRLLWTKDSNSRATELPIALPWKLLPKLSVEFLVHHFMVANPPKHRKRNGLPSQILSPSKMSVITRPHFLVDHGLGFWRGEKPQTA